MRCAVTLLVILSLAGCGGGGADTCDSLNSNAACSTAVTLSGLAAQGPAISGRIYLMDSAGQEHSMDTSNGQFSFDLAGLQPPLLLKAQWTDGKDMQRLYSFASAEGIANITPLTHFAVATASATQSLDALYAAPSAPAFAALQAALPGAVGRLQGYLQALMSQYKVANANPITARFAATHTGMDGLLDRIVLSTAGGSMTLSDRDSGTTLVAAPLSNLALSVDPAGWDAGDAAQAADLGLAINSQGLGLVAWSQRSNGQYLIKVRWLNGMDAGQTLSAGGDAGNPRLAFDGAGNAFALWVQSSNGRTTVWVRRYNVVSAQWSVAHQLSSDTAGSSHLPDLAVDQGGNAIAVWHQDDGRQSHFDGWLSQYAVAGGAWAAPHRFTDGGNSAFGIKVALNPSGVGLLAWQQLRGDGTAVTSQMADIAVRSLSSAGALGALRLVNADGLGQPLAAYVYGQLALAVNASGAAGLLWSQRLLPSLPMHVAAAQYLPDRGWQAASTISRDLQEDGHSPQLALDAAGNAIAVWQVQTEYSAYGATNRYVAGSGWGTAGHFVDSKLGDALAPSLTMDTKGNASVAWFRWSDGNSVDLMLNRYLLDIGWAQAQVFAPLGVKSTIVQRPPSVAVDGAGQALLLWGSDMDAVASWL